MSESNITVKMHGIEATGTPIQIAELKKLLDEQNPIKIKFIPQTQPVPWVVQPYIYPQPYKTITNPYWDTTKIYCGTALSGVDGIQGVTAWNGDPKTNGISGTTSNDAFVLGDDGNMIKYNYSTYSN